jgi:signal transduction histidine kinase
MPNCQRLLVSLVVVLIYIVLFVPLYHLMWRAVAICVLLPVLVTAYNFGWRGGLVAALIAAPLNLLLFRLVNDLEVTLRGPYFSPAHIAFLLIAVTVGYLRDMKSRLEVEIARREASEARLREQERQLRLRFDSIPVPTLTWQHVDGNFVLVDYNPAAAEIWDGEINRAQGRTAQTIFRHRPDLIAFLDQSLSGQKTVVGEVKYQFQATGEERLLWLKCSFIPPDMVLTHIEDVTERQRAQHQAMEQVFLEDRMAQLRKLLGDISHDLKTPLASMKTSLYLIRKQPDPGRRAVQLDHLETQVERLDQLVTDIVTMTRLDNTHQLARQAINLSSLIRSMLLEFEPRIRQKNLWLKVNLDDSLPRVPVNVDELSHALAELIENAILYTPDKGTITLTMGSVGQRVCIKVQDTGIGIEAKDLSYIFRPFYRVDQARGTFHGGAGLGLAIVHRIVELHQGEIIVESQPGQGTTVCVWLPLDPTPGGPA